LIFFNLLTLPLSCDLPGIPIPGPVKAARKLPRMP
jgi:hypothetical protein